MSFDAPQNRYLVHMRKRTKKPVCPNCGHQLDAADNFCPQCGQENHTHQLPLKHFALEFIESLFHFDTKLFQTVKDLFLKPGEVTKNFNDNKRARYVPPFRFYLFTSAIYFLALASLQSPEVKWVESGKKEDTRGYLNFNTSEFNEEQKKELQELSQKEDITRDDLYAFLAKHNKDITWESMIALRLAIRFYKIGDPKGLGHKILKNISYLMFVLMPLFALLLYLFYRKKTPFYSAHLVFSVHFHTLAFILLLATLLIGKLFSTFDFSGITLLILLIYFFLSLKNVFGESWGKTILKGTLLSACYLVIFILSLITATVGSLF